MLRTRICELLGIEHPVVLGGMASATSAELVAAVSVAGGLGILGASYIPAARQREEAERIRELTDRPFGLNHLLFMLDEERYATTLELRPRVVSTAWAWPEQNLREAFERAHAAGSLVVHMVSTVPEAVRAVEAGADAIVAQGSEGGGHVSFMGTLPVVRMVVRAVAPVPVLAAGGIADGAGLAAALALGAEGVLLGTRFLASEEARISPGWKRAVVESDGHDTLLSEIPDLASGRVWPGAVTRLRRNRLVERWAGREWQLRAERSDAGRAMLAARERDDADESVLMMGQTAGLVDDVAPAGEIVARVVAEAEEILSERLPALVRAAAPTV